MADQDQVKNPNDASPSVALLQMITGYWVAQVIYVAAKLVGEEGQGVKYLY